jgi:hypothetical protein
MSLDPAAPALGHHVALEPIRLAASVVDGHHGKANRLLLKQRNAEDNGEPGAFYEIFGDPSEME